MGKSIYCFGERASYTEGNKEEEEKAKKYLELWKEFQLEKLSNELYYAKLLDEHWTTRPPEYMGTFARQVGISIRLAIEIEFKFEIPYIGSFEKK